MSDLIEGFLGKSVEGKKSKIPAKLDYMQSATGLFLGLFMWAHLFFDSSILISKDLLHTITMMFEGSLFLDKPSPVVDLVFITFVSVVFFIHALLAMRKFPITYRQWQAYRTHKTMMQHPDTSIWFVQAVTGFIMFFLGSTHVINMLFFVDEMGPYGSSMRMYDDTMWPFYAILLVAVVLHGNMGLYRLCVKWGWFEGSDTKASRATLRKIQWGVIAFFMIMGTFALATYVKYGSEYSKGKIDKFTPKTERQYDVKVRA